MCFVLMCFLDDLMGEGLAYITLLPIAIIVGFVTLIVFKRELHTVSYVTYMHCSRHDLTGKG